MKEIINAYSKVISTFYSFVEKKDVSQQNMNERVQLALFCRISCGCDSINVLLRAGLSIYASAIMRSMVEAAIDLEMLSNNKNHINTIAYSFAEQERKQLGYFEKDKTYAAFFREGANARLRLDKARAFTRKHQASQKREATIAKKFETLKRVDDYYGSYGMLCRSTHNNVDQLLDDHIKNDGAEVHIHRTLTKQELLKHTSLSLSTFIHALSFVHSLFGLTEEQHNTVLAAYEEYTQLSAAAN